MRTTTADLIQWRDELRLIMHKQIEVRHANPGRTIGEDIRQADESRDILSKAVGQLIGIFNYRIEDAQAHDRVKEPHV